jgi:hypothetical protein
VGYTRRGVCGASWPRGAALGANCVAGADRPVGAVRHRRATPRAGASRGFGVVGRRKRPKVSSSLRAPMASGSSFAVSGKPSMNVAASRGLLPYKRREEQEEHGGSEEDAAASTSHPRRSGWVELTRAPGEGGRGAEEASGSGKEPPRIVAKAEHEDATAGTENPADPDGSPVSRDPRGSRREADALLRKWTPWARRCFGGERGDSQNPARRRRRKVAEGYEA